MPFLVILRIQQIPLSTSVSARYLANHTGVY